MTLSREYLLTVWLVPLLCVLPARADAKSSFPNYIPNAFASSPQGACSLCHRSPSGGDTLTAFGQDVYQTMSNRRPDWAALYAVDSDGDGQTNGEELGDPCGEWVRGDSPPRELEISNPNDAESLSDDPNTPGCVDDSDTTDPSDESDVTDPADPTDETDVSDPADAADSTDPTDDSDISDSSDASDAADPTDSSDASEPTDASDVTEPAEESDVADVTDSSDESDPSDDTDPSQPADESDSSAPEDSTDDEPEPSSDEGGCSAAAVDPFLMGLLLMLGWRRRSRPAD